MNLSTVEPSQAGTGAPKLPPFPQIWIGYLLGGATTVAEFVALTFHPELAKQWSTPPLYLFLPSFVGGVYWFVCIYRLHVVLAQVPGWKHPISPARAAGFHFIPIYNLYWLFRWPREIAAFVNRRLQSRVMKPAAVSVSALAALLFRVVDPGLGLILLFLPMSYVAECLRRALIAPSKENGPAS